MVKRFEITEEYAMGGTVSKMKEDPQGEWVKHSDFEKLVEVANKLYHTLIEFHAFEHDGTLRLVIGGEHTSLKDPITTNGRYRLKQREEALAKHEELARQTLKELGVE